MAKAKLKKRKIDSLEHKILKFYVSYWRDVNDVISSAHRDAIIFGAGTIRWQY